MKSFNKEVLDKFNNYCYQADLKNGLKFLDSLDDDKLSKKNLVYFNKIKNLFSDLSVKDEIINSEDDFVRKICESYRKYYKLSTLKIKTLKESENILFEDLKNILAKFDHSVNEIQYFNDLDKKITHILEEKDHYYLGGRTLPLRCTYIWKKMDKVEYKIKLIDKVQNIDVFLMKDFVESGWLDYITLGLKKAGGWATKEGLYCVFDCYKEDIENESEYFMVNYLAHEAQHFSDYMDYPDLIQHDLEYRAKLVELIKFTESKELLDRFSKEAMNNLEIPHSYASYIIKESFMKLSKSDQLSNDKVSEIAKDLYDEHTNELKKDPSVKSVIL